MKNMDFGFTLTVLGMGGTLMILFLISLVVDGLNRICIRSDCRTAAKEVDQGSAKKVDHAVEGRAA